VSEDSGPLDSGLSGWAWHELGRQQGVYERQEQETVQRVLGAIFGRRPDPAVDWQRAIGRAQSLQAALGAANAHIQEWVGYSDKLNAVIENQARIESQLRQEIDELRAAVARTEEQLATAQAQTDIEARLVRKATKYLDVVNLKLRGRNKRNEPIERRSADVIFVMPSETQKRALLRAGISPVWPLDALLDAFADKELTPNPAMMLVLDTADRFDQDLLNELFTQQEKTGLVIELVGDGL
jgi:hypothetical protein